MSDNVIHVRFGPGGGKRVEEPPPAPPERVKASPPPAPAGPTEPYGELFRRAEVARLFAIPEGRLKYWDRLGFIKPSGHVGGRRYYTFQDLIGVRVAKELLEGGAPLPAVRRSLDNLRRTLPHVTRPLNELRVRAEGHTVLVHDHERVFEPETGQLHLDFEVRSLRDDVVRILRPDAVDPERRRRAYQAYLDGCRFDEDPNTFDRAEDCYRQAITLDPSLANALTNWGNLRFRRGDVEDAERLYRRALSIDEEQPEAYYNLGFLAFERGEMDEAVTLFASAVEHDPGFADAHFNLAMALEEVDRRADARVHWQTYLELDPAGPWAEIARRHLHPAR
ncbi:MAG: tetratricopeptide repeat protein [Candidatus Brachytrichaceae bacterium NZ_4S206]